MDERLARTIEALREVDADWAVLSGSDSIAYTLGYSPVIDWGASPFAAGPNIAVIGRDGSAGLVALEGEAASVREGIVVGYDGYGQLPSHPPDALYLEALKTLVRRLGVAGRIATEVTLPAIVDAHLPSPRVRGFAAAFRRQRMTKTATEIHALRHAAEVTAAGQREFLQSLRAGVSELQLFSDIRCAMETTAGERLAIAGDLISGRTRTASMWGRPTNRTIDEGDAVLADLAPRVAGYWGDSCATTVVGSANHEQMALFEAAHTALELAVAELRPGMTAGAAHRLVHDCILNAGFDYRHHTGHGIGTAVHEHPRLAEGETETLRENMVLMVEPGAYDPAIGGARAEWMLHITKTGCAPLSPFPLVASINC